jgi:hypothetical protein
VKLRGIIGMEYGVRKWVYAHEVGARAIERRRERDSNWFIITCETVVEETDNNIP